ncbi:MAG: hypothetical protein C0513_09175 [Isosphaera sp.]|nr:hypothetical protein [Isosphaera sp.]
MWTPWALACASAAAAPAAPAPSRWASGTSLGLNAHELIQPTRADGAGDEPPTAPGPAGGAPGDPAAPGVAPDLTPDPAASRWIVRFQPRLWFAGLTGELTLPNTATGVSDSVELADIDLNNTVLNPSGEFNIQADKFLFSFTAASIQTSRGAAAPAALQLGSVAAAPGDRLETDLEFNTLHASLTYRLLEHDFGTAGRTVFRANLGGGVRYTEFDILLTNTTSGGALRTSPDFFELLAVAKTELQLAERFSIDLELAAGGLADSASFDLTVGFSWRPVDFIAGQIGYRILFLTASEGDAANFDFTGSAAGLFGAIVVRF